MTRFRTHKYAFTTDIQMMFRQILIDPAQRDLLRIMWKTGAYEEPVIYRLKTVTYGTASAPFLAIRTLKQLAMDEASRFPLASKVALQDVYMDDVVSGAQNLDTACQLQCQLQNMLETCGMKLHKWDSNSKELLNSSSDQEHSFSTNAESAIKTLALEELKIDRYILADSYVKLMLLGYADASESAYGAVVYMHSVKEDGILVNLKKDELRSIADELKLVVPDNAKVLDLRELIQESEIYKNDKETYQAIVDCVLEEINDRRNENENRLEIEKIKLSQLEKELEIAKLHNQSGKSLPLQNENQLITTECNIETGQPNSSKVSSQPARRCIRGPGGSNCVVPPQGENEENKSFVATSFLKNKTRTVLLSSVQCFLRDKYGL
ncbi:integrase catalytic domain-containing protein [Trichonephila clavipes]|nr:integrase catalytic domain-containing protein [Trichonephila clavipes]